MPKNETVETTVLESVLPTPDSASGGCAAFRTGLVLTALQKRMARAGSEEERAGLRARIEALEEEMGF